MEIFLGRDPKQQRLAPNDEDSNHDSIVLNDDDDDDDDDDDEDDDDEDDDDDVFDCWISSECLAINMIEEACQNGEVGSTHANLDSWMMAAVTLSASIDEVSLMIQRKAALYISSTDTLNICFDDRMCESTEHTMTNADRSILETTVASFAAGMAKQIESLRKTVVVAGDHPFINYSADYTGNADNSASHRWASGPVGHRAGIAACLMQRLKSEIMDPMTKLQSQREKSISNRKKTFSGDEASFIAQNPMRMFHLRAEDSVRRSLPPAPWEVGGHNAEKDRAERIQEKDEFLSIYLDKRELDAAPEDVAAKTLPPPSVLRFMDLPSATSEAVQQPQQHQKSQQYHSQPKIPIKQPLTLKKPPPVYEEEEGHMGQLQRESATLLATYQHSDMEGVQKVERRMVEITSLLSRFTDLIAEQQDSIFMIHDQALKSKENVVKGQDQLVDAANRGGESKHPMASFIFLSALLLLMFNWITP
jgi:hypothetical protein